MGKIIIIYGLPAAGKTTQARKVAKKYGLYHFIMSDKLKELAASGSELGDTIKEMMAAGDLVPDEIILAALRDVKTKAVENGIVFDGFPRMLNQGQMLEQMLTEVNLDVAAMIVLKVSSDEVKNRISERAVVENRVDDNNQAVVENRINVFLKESVSLIDYYREKNKLHELNGEEDIETIESKISQIIDSL